MSESKTEQTWTLGSLLNWTAKHLAQKGIESPRLDAEILLAQAAGCRRIDLYGMRFAEPASPEVRQAYRELIRKRLEGCPVAYLVGKKEFYGLEFEVSPAVLIPRPDSEHLVMECVRLVKPLAVPRILDVGTGSGNLVVAIAKHVPTAVLTAIDASAAALDLARKNAARHGLDGRIRFLEGDLFAPLAEDELFDCIVSNPPYIPTGDIPKLPAGVRDYEPHQALDGGADGFAVFDRLVDQARRHLAPPPLPLSPGERGRDEGGHLLVEIGSPQEAHARERLAKFADYELGPTIFDSSRHPRVVQVRKRQA